jgi:hypothetical protein
VPWLDSVADDLAPDRRSFLIDVSLEAPRPAPIVVLLRQMAPPR